LVKSFRNGLFQNRSPHVRLRDAFERRRADEPSGHRVDLDPEAGRLAELARQIVGDDGPQLDDRVVALPLDTAGAHDKAAFVERQVWGIEEEHLADLSIERIDPQRTGRGSYVRHRQLQLDAVSTFRQCQQLCGLLVGEPRRLLRGGCHG
jgi:hypothetical protein